MDEQRFIKNTLNFFETTGFSLDRASQYLASTWFSALILFVFIAEAVWLAITSNYPMAFDESYHFLLIQFFSHHLNPLITKQAASTYGLGAIAHDPSFLYHYLLSFPYRLIAHFSFSLKTQVISLRLINIAFVATGIILARNILQRLGLSRALANIVLLVFALTPIVTALAAQINYDTLLFLLSVICFDQTIKIIQQVKKGHLDVQRVVILICLCLFTSVEKYSFLPIFTGIVLVVAWYIFLYWREHKTIFLKNLSLGFVAMTLKRRLLLAAIFILGSGLFINFYGVNLVKYHDLTPQCQQILTTNDCQQYYVWARNNTATLDYKAHPTPLMNPISYTKFWFKVEYYQLFAEIIPTGGLVYIAHYFYVFIICSTVLAAICVVLTFRQIMKQNRLILPVLIISLIYLAGLWLDNYTAYHNLGQPLAIQGRYLIPVLIYFYALAGLAFHYVLTGKRLKKYMLEPVVVATVIFMFVYFGGYVNYMSKISPYYKWPRSSISGKY